MNNDLANFSVLTGLLVEMATAVKLRLCEPIRQPTKGILYYKYFQESRDFTCWFHNLLHCSNTSSSDVYAVKSLAISVLPLQRKVFLKLNFLL